MQKNNSGTITSRKKALRKFYNKTVVEHCLQPKNFRDMRDHDGFFRQTGEDGDNVEIFVRLDNDRIAECTFLTNACAATLACGSIATEMIEDLPYSMALEAVAPKKIINALGGLPEGNTHCAHRISQAVRRAIADALAQKRSPWKKLYRRQ